MRSVFEPLPREGSWDTALLIDGNIGIGGDPRALLRRAAEVVRHSGSLVVEAAPAGTSPDLDERVRVRVDNGGGESTRGEAFPWARVGARALLGHARGTGWVPAGQWSAGGRRFVVLRRADAACAR